MSTTPESASKKTAEERARERLAKAEAEAAAFRKRVIQARNKLLQIENKKTKGFRAADTRRKCILGGALLHNPTLLAQVVASLDVASRAAYEKAAAICAPEDAKKKT